MAKVKKAFFCKNCGFEAPKWLGRCPSCGEWNTFAEEIIARESGSVPAVAAGPLPAAKPQRVRDIRESEHVRLDLGNAEVNRVLGGGMVPGSLVLVGGEPGIGKSTLSLQIALAANGLKTLYVSGEESAEQIKMRAARIGIGNDECLIYPETLLENIVAQIAEHRPDLVVIDSIQTIYTDLLDSSAGSVSQIRECAATLLKYAKSTGTSIFIIGHITKDGSIAGPKILEHIVDVVLQFEGDSNNIYRILRGIKNRFGATFEIGVFEMLDAGLRGVDNPSEILLTHYEEPLSGIAVGASADGVRPYLIEVQALVSGAAYGTPQRSTTGYDARRMNMLLAVLEKRVGMKMFQKDVFLNFAGGGRGPGAGPRGRGGGDLVLLRPSRGRGGLLRRRNRPVGRSAPRAPHRTAHQRGRKARIQAHHRVGLSGQRRQASQRHRGSPDKQRRPAPEGAFHRIGRHQKQQIRKGAASGSRGRKIFDSPRANRQAAAPPCGGLLVTALRADHRKLPPENATEVPESESSDLAWASGRIAAGMEWILLFPR